MRRAQCVLQSVLKRMCARACSHLCTHQSACWFSLPAYSRVHAHVSLDAVLGARSIHKKSFEGSRVCDCVCACVRRCCTSHFTGNNTRFHSFQPSAVALVLHESMFVWNMRMRSATEFHRNNLLTISGIRVNSMPFGNRSHWAPSSIHIHNRIQCYLSISKSIWFASIVYHFLCWNNNNLNNNKLRHVAIVVPHTDVATGSSWHFFVVLNV